MAHYVAQLIEAAEGAPDAAKDAANDRCAKAVLELWKYHADLPRHLRPLREIEPVLRTLALLDVTQTDYMYYPQALREAAIAEAGESAKKWLQLATGLDYTARLLIQFALRNAAQAAASNEEAWVDLALEAGAAEGAERFLMKFVSGAEQGADDQLRDRLSRLEQMAELATHLAEEIRAQLSSSERETE